MNLPKRLQLFIFWCLVLFFGMTGSGIGQTIETIPNSDAPAVDLDYVVLMKIAKELDRRATEWDQNCHPITEPCKVVAIQIIADSVRFVDAAKRYHSQGEDCSAVMRQRIINFITDIFEWNIICAADAKTPGCAEKSKQLEQQKLELMKASQDCRNQNTRL